MHILELILAFLLIFIVASLLSAWAWRYLPASRLLGSAPTQRALQIFLLALLAPLIALWSVFFLYVPEFGGWALIEHCHAGECAPHSPHTLYSLFSVCLMTLLLVLLAVLLAGLFLQIKHQLRRSQLLSTLANKAQGEVFYILDNPQAFALCSGFWQPKILLSRGLYEALTADELAVVLSHERAHAKRQDNLRKLLLFCATVCWPKKLRSNLLEGFELCTEQACDQAAAARHGQAAVNLTLTRLTQLQAICQHNTLTYRLNLHIDNQRLLTLDTENQTEYKPGFWLLLLSLLLVEIPILSSGFHLLAELMI